MNKFGNLMAVHHSLKNTATKHTMSTQKNEKISHWLKLINE